MASREELVGKKPTIARSGIRTPLSTPNPASKPVGHSTTLALTGDLYPPPPQYNSFPNTETNTPSIVMHLFDTDEVCTIFQAEIETRVVSMDECEAYFTVSARATPSVVRLLEAKKRKGTKTRKNKNKKRVTRLALLLTS